MKGLVLLLVFCSCAWGLVSPLRMAQENKRNTLREKHKRYHHLRNAHVGCLEAAQIEKGAFFILGWGFFLFLSFFFLFLF
jgi:hypothetical protein